MEGILQNTMVSKPHFFVLVLSFEDHFRFVKLFLKKYLSINRIKSFNAVKKKKDSKKLIKNQ